ncbi:MAG: DUF6526 family protein [Gemmatimonadetes bacterium]|nr:DUF6526 family protein [Gemmatimonadota bacterium]
MPPTGQTYANHTQFFPPYHYVTSPLGFLYFIWAAVRLVQHRDADHLFAFIGAAALLGLVAVARLSPLRAQDRLIRLEEQLRYERLLTADQRARVAETFSPRHYIALRFASDGELPGLVEAVLANPSMPSKQIKQSIKTWRGDYFRV